MTSPILICVGNAIVDILAKVEDSFLELNKLNKGSMSLVNCEEFEKLFSNLSGYKIKSGGSAANTAVGYSSFGGKSVFFGTIANDNFGLSFKKDLNDLGIKFLSSDENLSNNKTSKSLILISNDGERTMSTYLGASISLSLKTFDQSILNNKNILYLEGYLFDKNETKNTIMELCEIAKSKGTTICLSLSDSFCVERHKEDFISLIKKHIDILFGNDQEITSLLNKQDKENLSEIVETAVVTDGSKGANIFEKNHRLYIPPIKGLNVLDTTGAGDLFASGFLFGVSKNLSLFDCGELATKSASHIIQQFGARPEKDLSKLIMI